MVNEIKAHHLQTRLFKILCEEVGAAYTSLLFYSKARWLSRGKVTRHLITLRSEVREFLYAKQSPLATYWDDPKFVQQVAYLADILEKLNELNVSMQGRNDNVLTLSDKINGFQGKLNIWRRKALHDTFDMFPTLHGLLEEDDLLIKSQITEHLDGLSGKFEEWFGDLPGEELDWVRNPIRVEEWDMPLKHLEELSDLQADRSTMQHFETTPLDTFWLSLSADYPCISDRAVRVLLPFAATYLAESTFSDLTVSSEDQERAQDCSWVTKDPDDVNKPKHSQSIPGTKFASSQEF
ncbi:zinc finger BED domain-containing protein 5-like [Frankliniella occidentalis]|uniref:Zinc finger BED domain-containing protein 5-like n=1 Tax=Frankliniella occidentalis TaxID=133901 RepID=A0A9C6X2U7_FRAOC|nr:zinc finger BED domain-containing protein 5-like [Frankliniella occidentalis]